jgi:hypothetical protein
MSASFSSEKILEILGHAPSSGFKNLSDTLVLVRLTEAEFSRSQDFWKSLAVGKLPGIRGISALPREGHVLLRLWLVPVGARGIVCVETQHPQGQILPDFSEIWPQADWWQEEMSAFGGMKFPPTEIGGMAWRRA